MANFFMRFRVVDKCGAGIYNDYNMEKEKFCLKDKLWYKKIKEVLSADYFPFVTAGVVLLCYYAGLDLVAAYYLMLVGTLMLVILDDLTPALSQLLFLGTFVSMQHTPSEFFKDFTPSDFYTREYVLAQLGALIALFAGGAAYRIAVTARAKRFTLNPTFFGLCAFAVALILNGVFSAHYNPMSLGYGLALAALFLGIFAVFKDNVEWNGANLKKLSYGFVAFGAMLTVELLILYLTCDGLFEGGELVRRKLGFGWGMYNTIGMYLLLCLPFPFYLATVYKHGYLFYLLSYVFLGAIFLTFSRQAWGGAAVVFTVCVIALLVKEKGTRRKINAIITAVAVALALIVMIIMGDKVVNLIKKLFESVFGGEGGSFTGNGRLTLWKDAIKSFKSAPVFGVGFFASVNENIDPGFAGVSFVPGMFHDTFMQLLGSCGAVGFLAYVVHRVQTVMSFVKKISYAKIIVGVAVLGLLIVNLVDNHLFYFFPTIIYSGLIACLDAAGRAKNETYGAKESKTAGADGAVSAE